MNRNFTIFSNYMIRLAGLSLVVATLLALVAGVQLANAQDSKNAGAAVFKIPDGYMRVPVTDFRGALMLDPKKPAGMFVTYPNDNETTEALRNRLLAFLGPMFIHEKDKPKGEGSLVWTTKSLPAHPDDGEGKATINTYGGANEEVQVTIYERTTGVRPFLYGYFGMRHNPSKSDDAKFLDDQGQGVKAFDKLWKSFPK
jgi:hypothetical protein